MYSDVSIFIQIPVITFTCIIERKSEQTHKDSIPQLLENDTFDELKSMH